MIQEKSLIWTRRELEVINKKLSNEHLTQQDSNYLSKFIRPKLKEINHIDSSTLLKKLAYNQKIRYLKNKIKNIILNNINDVASITLYGSIVYSNYTNFNDIDVLVTVNKKFWDKLGEKYRLINEIEKKAKKSGISLDIKIYPKKAVYEAYPYNISLLYQLKDSLTIYRKLELPKKTVITKLNLKMQSDYSYMIISQVEEDGIASVEPRSIYSAIRNLLIIQLIMEKVIDNKILLETLEAELGKNIINALKGNKASKIQKKIAYYYLDGFYKKLLKIIDASKEVVWEKEA